MTFRTYTLGEIFYIENGYAFKSSEFKATGTPVIKIKNIKAGHFKDDEFSYVESIFLKLKPNKVTRPDDLLISMSGNRHDGNPDTWVGKVCRFNKNEKMLINQRVGALRFRSPTLACANYMGYLLSQMLYQEYFISIATSSGGQANLSPNQILSMEVTLPTIFKQSVIASILGSLDDKIDLNRRTNETLEAMARALFRDWFVDFGPTRAKMAGEVPYLAPELWELFPDRLDDEGKPEGWELQPTGNYIKNLDSRRVPLSSAQRRIRQGKYPYYGAASIVDYIDDYIFDGTYLLIGEDGTVQTKSGYSVTQYVHGKIWVNNHAHVLQGDNGVATEHLLLHFSHILVEPYITGAVQPKLSQKNMNSIPFMFSSERINFHFRTAVEPLFNKILTNEIEMQKLAQLRDLLLPKLMSGEISIRDAEKMVEDAA